MSEATCLKCRHAFPSHISHPKAMQAMMGDIAALEAAARES